MHFDLFDGTQNKILDAKTYGEFRQALVSSNCGKCPLSRERRNIVVDRGNPNAKAVLIGEAPGETEDRQGKAFVGRAGKLLDQMLLELGFDTNRDSLIINVAKCRPPGNRAPGPEEAAACRPYLLKQISLVKPRLILLLGATALKHITPIKPKTPLSKVVGKFFENRDFPGVRLMTVFHPAYILRDPRKKPVMREHLEKFVAAWKANHL
jgi:DNA polymerase